MGKNGKKKKWSRRQSITFWVLAGLAALFLAFNFQWVKVHIIPPLVGFDMPLALHLIAWLALGVVIGILYAKHRERSRTAASAAQEQPKPADQAREKPEAGSTQQKS